MKDKFGLYKTMQRVRSGAFVDKYILVGKTPVPELDLLAWARWFEKYRRHIAVSSRWVPHKKWCWRWLGFKEEVYISTIFLGIDHSFGDKVPLLFETMIFGRGFETNEYQTRCETWEQAIEMHRLAVEVVDNGR